MSAPTTSQDPSSSQLEGFSEFWLLPELLSLVSEHISSSDLAALCLVCRSFYSIANPILYKHVSLDILTREETKALGSLQISLTRNPSLANHVRSIDSRAQASRYDYKRGDTVHEPVRTHSATLADIIQRCPNLRHLCTKDRSPLPPSAFSDPHRAIEAATSLSRLTFELEDEWPVSYAIFLGLNEATLLDYLSRPAIHSLALTVDEAPAHSPLRAAAFPTSTTITHLRLHYAHVNTDTLRRIIMAVPHVRDLDVGIMRIADLGSGHVDPHLSLEELGAALAPASDTVERLRLEIAYESTGPFVTDCGGGEAAEWGIFGRFPSLRRWGRLKALEVTPEVLCGWEGVEVVPVGMLPEGLEELLLRCEFAEWYYSKFYGPPLFLCSKVEECLKSGRLVGIKHLTLTSVTGESEGEAAAMASVKRTCDELGVRFSQAIRELRSWGI